MAVFGFLAAILALVFWVSELPRFRKVFEVVPPVIYVYFLPMLATTGGDFTAGLAVLRMDGPVPAPFRVPDADGDVGSIVKLGWTALFMVAAGTVGVGDPTIISSTDLTP